MFVSPNLICLIPATLKIYFKRTGSSRGSRSSPTLSSKIGRPSLRAYSNLCTKFSWSEGFRMISLWPELEFSWASLFLIQRLAWPWGSIINGHLRAFSIMIPFSIEKESTGSPVIYHWRIRTGSPKTRSKLKSSKQTSESSLSWYSQLSTAILRYF